MPHQGFATVSGTEAYAARFHDRLAPQHFRSHHGLRVSSIGFGTYLGETNDETDRRYEEAILKAVESGCNVIDTAINYRCQRSERAVGRALGDLVARGVVSREEILVATKGGFIPYDTTPPADGKEALEYFKRVFLGPGVCMASDIVAGCHCLAPGYLRHQIAASRANLGLETIDLYYLHNPETQLQAVSRETLMTRLREAFAVLEDEVEAGHIRMYGLATWEAFRARPNARDALSLAEIVRLARTVAGHAHHFHAVQLPYNIGMPQAFTEPTQQTGDLKVPFLIAAQEHEIFVATSVALMQRHLSKLPPIVSEAFPGLKSDAQRAIQFVRSTPGVHVALVGMSSLEHVAENLALAQVPPAKQASFMQLFVKE